MRCSQPDTPCANLRPMLLNLERNFDQHQRTSGLSRDLRFFQITTKSTLVGASPGSSFANSTQPPATLPRRQRFATMLRISAARSVIFDIFHSTSPVGFGRRGFFCVSAIQIVGPVRLGWEAVIARRVSAAIISGSGCRLLVSRRFRRRPEQPSDDLLHRVNELRRQRASCRPLRSARPFRVRHTTGSEPRKSRRETLSARAGRRN